MGIIYNICLWYGNQENAWNAIAINDEFFRGGETVTVVDKTDIHVTIEYHRGKRIKLAKKQALSSLYHPIIQRS